MILEYFDCDVSDRKVVYVMAIYCITFFFFFFFFFFALIWQITFQQSCTCLAINFFALIMPDWKITFM